MKACLVCKKNIAIQHWKAHIKTKIHMDAACLLIPVLYPLTINWNDRYGRPKTVSITRRELARVQPFIYQSIPSDLLKYHMDTFCDPTENEAREYINEHTLYGITRNNKFDHDDMINNVCSKINVSLNPDDAFRVAKWCKRTNLTEPKFDINVFDKEKYTRDFMKHTCLV